MGLAPKKHLGQHFLTAPYYCRRIAAAVPAGSGENLLEIGPGRGALSVHLKERFPRFHCVEKDPDLIGALSDTLGEGAHVIHNQDALRFDFSSAGFPLHVVGNLPYSVGALLIKKTLFYGSNIRSCTFMVQREVARRIAAVPGSKEYGFLSILVQYFGIAKILFHVPPGAFFPPPKVDSSVFQIIPDPALMGRIGSDEWQRFFTFVTKGFSQRRKRLAKVLANGSNDARLNSRFEEIGLHRDVRAEEVDVGHWVSLFQML